MPSKTLVALLVAAVLAGLAWHYRDHDALRGLLRPVRAGLQGAAASGEGARPGRTTPAASAPAARLMRKCLKDGQVLYTDDACPPGSQEEAVSGGSLTVFSDRPAASTPARR